MDIVFHYPPELLQLLIQAIPLLTRSKLDTLSFFQGAGVSAQVLADLRGRVAKDRQGITKYEIVQVVLTRLNEKGESALRERREVLRRVVEFEDYSTCWPQDELKAKGLVGEIRRVVGVKDAFTRMAQEKDREANQRREGLRAAQAAREALHRSIDAVRAELGALFKESDAQRRGARFEQAINKLFETYGILVRESFRVVGDKAEGVIEQIDGVIELEDALYLVEVKWVSGPIRIEDVSRHLVRIQGRYSARGLFISVTEFSSASLKTCEEALQRTVVTLGLLEEIVEILEQYGDLKSWLKRKVQAAIVDKKPFVKLRPRQG